VRLAENLARLESSGVESLPPGAPEPDQLVRRSAQTLRYAAYGPRYWYEPTFDCAPLYTDDVWDMAHVDWLAAQLGPRHPDAAAIAGVKPPPSWRKGSGTSMLRRRGGPGCRTPFATAPTSPLSGAVTIRSTKIVSFSTRRCWDGSLLPVPPHRRFSIGLPVSTSLDDLCSLGSSRRDQPGSLSPTTGQRPPSFLNGLTRRFNRLGRRAWPTGLRAAGSAQQRMPPASRWLTGTWPTLRCRR